MRERAEPAPDCPACAAARHAEPADHTPPDPELRRIALHRLYRMANERKPTPSPS